MSERHGIALGGWAVGLAACAVALAASAAWGRTMSVRDEGSLRFKSSSGSQLIDEGHANGTLPGWVKVSFTYDGNPTVYARFTIYARGGTINGHATGRLSNATSSSPSFRGSLSITGGGGRFARASGSGQLFGVFYRRSYGLTVQAISGLRY